MQVLLLGASGQLGGELRTALTPFADVTAPDRSELDCARVGDVEAFVRALAPDCVVNAAAYTNVNDAERDREQAERLNATLPACLASSCDRIGASLVHFSSDYVFSGDSVRPYREDDATGPVNWYGETKLAGERAILAATDRATILRTGWIYGLTGHNFFRTMLRLAQERTEIRVVNDQCGAPTWSRQVALAAASMVVQLGCDVDAWRRVNGICHISAGGETSWHRFASRLLSLDPARAYHVVQRITAIRSVDGPAAARRPAYSVLDCGRLADRFGIRLPSWEHQLELVWESYAGHRDGERSASGLQIE